MVIAVSSFSLRPLLGPVTFRSLDVAGSEHSITLDSPRTITFPEFIARVKTNIGAGAIEICQVQLDGPADARLPTIRDALDEYEVSLLGMPIDVGDISHPVDEVRESSIRASVQWFDTARMLGSRYVRINALSGLTASGQAAPFTTTVDSVRRLSMEAAERGLELLLENKGGLADYPARMLEVVEAVGRDSVGIILDTGNFEPLAGAMISRLRGAEPQEDQLGLDFAYEMIELLAPHATVVHAKSHGFDGNGVQGPLDLERALGSIAAAGFAGPVTIEYEGIVGDPWINTGRTVDIVRRAFA